MKKIKITITIPEWLDNEVEKYCKENYLTKSGFICVALEKMFLPFPDVVTFEDCEQKQ